MIKNIIVKLFYGKLFFIIRSFPLLLPIIVFSQTHFPGDPFHLLIYEKAQFDGKIPLSSNLFRPILFNLDKNTTSAIFRNEIYYNDNAPNQENMDIRYFSKGVGKTHPVSYTTAHGSRDVVSV